MAEPWKDFQSGAGDAGPWTEFQQPSTSPVPTAPVAPKARRTLGEVAKDTAVGVAQGAANLGFGLAQLGNLATGGNVDRFIVKPAQRVLDKAMGGTGESSGIAGASSVAGQIAGRNKSEPLRTAQEDLAETKGVLPTIKKVVTNPMLVGQFVAEQAAMLATMGVGSAGTAASVGQRAATAAAARGATPAVSRTLGAEAGRQAAVRQNIGATGAMGAGFAGNATIQDALAQPDEVWAQNEDFTRRVQAGEDPDAVKESIALRSGQIAAAVAGPISAATGALTAKLETDIFTRNLPVAGVRRLFSREGAKQVGSAVGRESVEEAIQEGGEQFAQNLGIQTSVTPSRGLMEGVPESMAIGGTVGGVIGGGLGVGGTALSRPQRVLPGGAPVPDPANGPLSRATNQAVDNGAVDIAAAGKAAAAAVESAARGEIDPAQAPAPDQRALDTRVPSRPWMDETTGVAREPTDDEIKLSLHQYFADVEAAGTKASRKAIVSSLELASKRVNPLIDAVVAERKQGINAANFPPANEGQPDVDATRGSEPVAAAAGTDALADGGLAGQPGNQSGGADQQADGRGVQPAAEATGRAADIDASPATGAREPVAPKPANAGMFDRMLAERDKDAARKAEQTATAPATPAPPTNLDTATGEELGIDVPWPSAAEHQQPDAIVRALKQGAARNKNRPDGIARIAETYNVSKDTARALRNRALSEMQAEAGSSRRADVRDKADSPAVATSLDEIESRLSAERRQRIDEAGGRDGKTDLDRALQNILIGGVDNDGLMAAVRFGVENGRSDIATAAAAKLRRSADSAAKQVPGVPESSPKYAQILETLRKQANAARVLAEQAVLPQGDSDGRGNDGRGSRASSGLAADDISVANSKAGVGTASRSDEGSPSVSGRLEAPDVQRQDDERPGMGATPGDQVANAPGAAAAQGTAGASADARAAEVTAAANEAATSPLNDRAEPTDAQKEAGNYKVGRVRLNGHDISVENPAGSKRNPKWPALKDHYGYIRGTIGKDKDHVDVFMTENAHDTARPVFVVDQVNKDGTFDEHKVVMGAANEADARAAYLRNYSKGWTGLGAITEMSQDDFKAWVRDKKKTSRPAGKLAKPAMTPSVKGSKRGEGASRQPDASDEPYMAGARANVDRLKKDKAFRAALKKIGDPHIESEVAFKAAQGWEDAKAGRPANDRHLADVSKMTHGMNPRDAYIAAYMAGKGLEPREVRAREAAQFYLEHGPDGEGASVDAPVEPPSASETDGDSVAQAEDGNVRLFSKAPVDAATDDVFFSALLRAVETAKGAPRRGGAVAWKQWLDGAQRRGELKQEERDWLGVDAWLDGQESITREQVIDYVRANQVQVQETALGAAPSLDAVARARFEELTTRIQEIEAEGRDASGLIDERERLFQHPADAKFPNYTLPGGQNYRELLLRLPRRPNVGEIYDQQSAFLHAMHAKYGDGWRNKASDADLAEDARLAAAADAANGVQKNFYTDHFSEANIIAHVRFNERIDADGKRVLFLEEIQSDWHQKGRREGHAKRFKLVVHGYNGSGTMGAYDTREEAVAAVRKWNEENPEEVYGPEVEEGPDAPFKTTWPMLAFKRMVRYAADHGFERIAWTTGEQQAERYDLSKQVDSITAARLADGDFVVTANAKQGSAIPGLRNKRVKEADLPEVVGKDLADKIIRGESGELNRDKSRTYRGVDLKVGGDGMKGFYDRMLPSEVNKLVKRFGSKVGQIYLQSDNPQTTRLMNDGPSSLAALGGSPVHSIDITPDLRNAALGGQPLFSQRGAGQGGAHLTFDRALQIKADVTGPWGPNAPRVILVENAESFPSFAKADPDYRRAEGLFDGRETIWINTGAIRTERRLAEVLAHEGIGHYGVENVVGAKDWQGIVETIARHDQAGTGAESLQKAMQSVRRRYGDLDAVTFAKETIAVMAEQGAKNGILDRVVAAVRRWLRQNMPRLVEGWKDADIVALLGQADSFLRAGRTQAESRESVAALAFSRRGWSEQFPDAVLGVPAGTVAAHPDYAAAKAGDERAAFRLARDLVSDRYVEEIRAALPDGAKPAVVPVAAVEAAGQNQIPAMVATVVAQRLGLRYEPSIMQAERVSRGGSDGFHRLANQPGFTGPVRKGGTYLILDDTLAQGGTLAQLKTHIEDNGGTVLLATALTGKDYSRTIALSVEQLNKLRERFGDLEPWWRDTFGYGFEGFTQSEARFLLKLKGRPTTDAIRARVIAAQDRGVDAVGELDPADGSRAPGLTDDTGGEAGTFSKALTIEMDGRGERRIRMGGETFLLRGDRFYMVNGTGHPKDFRNLQSATEAAQRTGGEIRLEDPIDGQPTAWSVVVPELAAREAGFGRPLFSKAPADLLEDVEAVMAGQHREGLFARAKQFLKDATPSKIKDELRGAWLGALTTRHLTELGQDYFENIRHYSDFLAEQQADRNKLQTEGEAIVERARKWAGKNRPESRRLFDLMHQATIDGVDPAQEYKPLQFFYGGQLREATNANVKEAMKALREQMRGRSADNKKDMMAEVKMLRDMPARERARRKKYPALQQRWAELSPEAQRVYREFRDTYASRSDAVEAALIARINDTDAPENHKRRLINTIRQQFETQRLQGVYFPLQRFGQFFVAAEKGDGNTFLMFEKLSDLERAVKDLKARGFTVTAQGLKSEGRAQDAPSGTFVAEIIEQLKKAGVSNQTQDQIYQMYLQSLPELSMRKHAIHRKSVPGFDPDAVRAFAYNMSHGAHQLARLRYGHKLQNVLDLLKKQQDDSRREAGADTRRIAAGDAILEELNKRHEWINNPQDSNLTNLISSFGFTYYLGLTPAAALVNITQTPLITYPNLAARYGPIKAMNYLLKAMRDSARTFGNIQKTLTSAEELRAHAVLQQMGAIDKTQAHNLAGIAEGGMSGYNPGWAKAMEIVGFAFHRTEVVNRESSGMAAFRLARDAGESFEVAVEFAAKTIYDTHYDYSNANRARWMQSGTAKVLMMFRQYSLNTTWHIARMVWKSVKGESPEVRSLARRNLAGIMGMASLFAGVLGLPMMKASMGVLNAVAASFGDDDEPWDAETELRAFLTAMLGQDGAETLLTGPTNLVTGADIHSRVSLSGLWFRDADRELDGRGQYHHLLEQAAGPMGGVLKNVLVGKGLIDEGHVWRGIETMLPKALKDGMKSVRYATEGVNNLRGDAVVEDPSLWQAMLQLQGFTPAEVSQRYELNRSLKNYEQHILDRRQHLMNALAMSLRLNDTHAYVDTMDKINAYNRTHPQLGITPATIRRSMQSRTRYSARAEGGIVLNPKLEAAVRARVNGAN